MNEAEGYAASLRQQANWIEEALSGDVELDADELRAAASFIERQQAEIDKFKRGEAAK